MKQSDMIRQRRRLLSSYKRFVSPTVMEVDSNRAEIERLKRRISKYKKDDEDRRQGRKD